MNLRILTAEDIAQALPMADAIAAMKRAFEQLSAGQANVPVRINLPIPPKDRTTLVMPAYLAGEHQLAVKVISLFKDNRQKGLPLIHALVLVVDAETGCPKAVMDGASLTALRTGAASGAATDLMARKDAKTAAIFGAGVQGRKQIEAVRAVRPIERAWVFDAVPQSRAAFAEEMTNRLNVPVEAVSAPADALHDADIVCTATTSPTPVFSDADLKEGCHINAVGAYTPETREIPGETVIRARVAVDHRDACWEEAGDILMPIRQGRINRDHVFAELGEIAAGSKPGRESNEEITLFKSVGVAVQDVAAAHCALRMAEEMKLGIKVDL